MEGLEDKDSCALGVEADAELPLAVSSGSTPDVLEPKPRFKAKNTYTIH